MRRRTSTQRKAFSRVSLASASKKTLEELFHHAEPFVVVERSSAVCRAVHHLELNRGVNFSVSAVKFMRLVDGHLEILIAMQQEEGRIVPIHMEHGTGQPGQCRKLLRLAAEQEIERRHANLQAVRS